MTTDPIRFAVGDVTIQVVADLPLFELQLAGIFPQATPDSLGPHLPWLEPDHIDIARGVAKLACQSMLLDIGGKKILVDTCVGCGKPRPNRPDWNLRTDTGFIDRLRACGVAPEQVDIVFCTHLHADHIGWNTQLRDGRWVPTFPNARYLVGRTEMEHWKPIVAANPAIGHASWLDSVLPIIEAGQYDLVDDGYEIDAGAVLHGLPGHTPGQMGLHLTRGGERAVFCGDAIHSPVQIVEPSWSSAFCTDREQAARTRTDLLGDLAETGALLVPAHFRGSGRVRIARRAGGFFPQFA
jgi:glyoxylase-like metal-dependent hydrolase (beta-lactamase superfamily II)